MRAAGREEVHTTICRQCDQRCGIRVHLRDSRIHRVSGLAAHLQSRGFICPKGRAAVDTVYHPDRLLKPLKRTPDGWREIGLEQAMDEIASRLVEIRERHGARAVGVWKGEATGFAQQEEYVRRFIRAFGSPNYLPVDSMCYSSRYIAYASVQGFFSYPQDFARSDLILLWGTHPAVSHPPFMRPIAAARRRGSRLVVIDPRRTPLAGSADLHLRIRPGTDGALALGFCRGLIESGRYDRPFVEGHTLGFAPLAEYVRRFTLEETARITGLEPARIAEAVELLAARRPRVATHIGVSLEHQDNGVQTVRAIACLGGLCGAVDIPGGDFQPEGLGGRGLTLYDEIPLEGQLPIGADRFPLPWHYRRDGHTPTALDFMLGQGAYPLKALIVSAGNPVNTHPNTERVRGAFASLDLLVVRDLFLTETAELAHYVLPAASFLERSELHTYSNLQAVALSRRILELPGVRDEYGFWKDLADRLGFGARWFPWADEEEVNRWILEPTGLTPERLREAPGGLRYRPRRWRKYRKQGLPTPSGKFEFTSTVLKRYGYPELPEYRPPRYLGEAADRRSWPFVLITGTRETVFYHSRYRNIERFRRLRPFLTVRMHPGDAAGLGLVEGRRVRVISETGSLTARVEIAPEEEILPGVLRMPHGLPGEENVNRLTPDRVLDPLSGYPLLKSVPVRIEEEETDQ